MKAALLFTGAAAMFVATSDSRAAFTSKLCLGIAGVTFFMFGLNTLRADQLSGGRADGRSPQDFDPKQLAIGVQIEQEHTNNLQLAREIAMDHLAEDPQYYTKLVAAGL